MLKDKTICYFGKYNREYNRNAVLLKGIKENNWSIIECSTDKKGLKGYWEVIKKHRQISQDYGVLIVGYGDSSRYFVLLAKLISKKPVVWDELYSVYDSWVYDRQTIKAFSLKGFYHYVSDWLATKFADAIFLDTKIHVEHFTKLFKANPKKIFYVSVGANESYFDASRYSLGQSKDKFLVEFHGKYIPLQGVPYIVKAAKLLESHQDIRFKLIGRGQTYDEVMRLVEYLKIKNIEFIDRVPYSELSEYVAEADVCLGIFGDTEKAGRVIPNKLYESIAMGKPVITGRTKAIMELFTDRENVILCETANPKDLADKILELKVDIELRESIGEAALSLFNSKLTASNIAKSLTDELATVLFEKGSN